MGPRQQTQKRKRGTQKSESGVKIPFLDLSDDEIVRVLSLLWYRDLYRVITLTVRLRDIVYNNNTLVKYLLTNQVERNKWQNFHADVFCKSLRSHELVVFASRMPFWPTDIDTSNLRYELEEIEVKGQKSKCVAYSGSVLGKNRCFVANHYFPIFGQNLRGGPQTASDFPFTKPVFDPILNSTVPVLSGIAYFEITIHKALRSTTTSTADPEFTPCVAIGIANHRHRLNKMPGWDPNSFGFHGDDGSLFRGVADHGIALDDATFGEGDTVGFGITYHQLKEHLVGEEGPSTCTELFLTINGELIGKFGFRSAAFNLCTWFPCVGTDCHCPIEMNFGNKGVPFAFDVVQYEKDEVRPPPAPRRSGRAKAGQKKIHQVVAPAAPDVAENPTLLFRAPYSTESHYEGGLYRNREFWKQVKMHVEANELYDDVDFWIDDDTENDVCEVEEGYGSEGGEGSGVSGDSEDESVTVNGDQDDMDSNEGDEEEGFDDEDFSSEEDSIASESSGELVSDCW